jgi:hypothetical protein
MADMRRVSDSGTRDHCEVLSSLDRRAGFPPPWTGEEELHWRSYDPLEETPDLFLKLARLHQEPNFERAVLTFSHTYGVLGGSSTMGSSPKRYRP